MVTINVQGLNVGKENVAARKCYEKIGFVKMCKFVESLFCLK
jgi:predicted GNAT family acetyltransferase